MANDDIVAAIKNALMSMPVGPAALVPRVKLSHPKAAETQITKALIASCDGNPNDGLRKIVHDKLSEWDYEPASASWCDGTEPNSLLRRAQIYARLEIPSKLQGTLNQAIPWFEAPRPVMLEALDANQGWYTSEFRAERSFYWKHLKKYQMKRGKLDQESINSLDQSSTRIVERLTDPASPKTKATRGLVVGFVQSGKTTNFTAVLAKAIDAGYKLLIVLSGTTNLLRNQTQRRLDMELVGQENIIGEMDISNLAPDDKRPDYIGDPKFKTDFISFGGLPHYFNRTDLVRLTGLEDLADSDQGLNPLDFRFEKLNKRLPLFERENLDHASARLLVVKKIKSRLDSLIDLLSQSGVKNCSDIPALVIDDESDQASINTKNTNSAALKKEKKQRTEINGRIVKILTLLPRAQYIGYTATPFANVFVNPKESADIFPRDFILSLERPGGYMGARDFHNTISAAHKGMSNRRAYIRSVNLSEEEDDEQPIQGDRFVEAIDCFVFAAAIKKFREVTGSYIFDHHTMLVNEHVSTEKHSEAKTRIVKIWNSAGYANLGPGYQRLRNLFADFQEVWNERGRSIGLTFPKNFDELKPALSEALKAIGDGGSPVLVVNGDDDSETPDFNQSKIWKIITGGMKLSRGYTVEGLTVSYFGRSTYAQDTMMQMGRWFGYRKGYEDLIRLFINRAAPIGKSGKTIDLYSAFESACKDEEDFRDQLSLYEGRGGITPAEFPALVFNSFPQLRPTARNKMYNAQLAWRVFDYREPTVQARDKDGRKENSQLFARILGRLKFTKSMASADGPGTKDLEFLSAPAATSDVLQLMKGAKWQGGKCPIAAEIGFLALPELKDIEWTVVAPQIGEGKGEDWSSSIGVPFRCQARGLVGDRFNVFTTPNDVRFATWLMGQGTWSFRSEKAPPKKKSGVLLFYPTRERGGEKIRHAPVMGFALLLPAVDTKNGQKVAWVVRN